MVAGVDDFADLSSGIGKSAAKGVSKENDQGEKRPWLRVYETLPPQMLNAYGPAKFAKMSDQSVWTAISEPLKSGAEYMSELCSSQAERRGVGINRTLHALKLYCEYQQDPKIREQNKKVLNEKIQEELYQEIDKVLPSLIFCLAPKKEGEKKGASTLRASGVSGGTPVVQKSETELDKHAKVVYEFMDIGKVSRIRMLANWQSAAGMAYVAGVHHRALQCFRYFGNMKHGEKGKEVSLEEFQSSIKSRHKIGSSGINEEVEGVLPEFQ